MYELIINILAVETIVGTLFSVGVAYAAYYLASLFFSDSDDEAPNLNNYPVQTSMEGGPIIKVYGTERVAGNVIWLGPLSAYSVKHDTGDSGGKSGGGGSDDIKETRFKRSFLLAICEGPATILSAWKGKEEISLDDFTWFDGDSNSGIRALTGQDYGDWPDLCCAFFDEYELGTSEALPNITFEVASGIDLVGKTLIYDLAGLQAMNDDLAGDYVLMTDIDATDTATWNGGAGFVPIGESGDEFTGTFHGRNHTIDGLHIDRATSYQGLFGYTDGATISNFKLINCDLDISSYSGPVVGYGDDSTFTDIYADGDVTGNGNGLGGFVGRLEGSTCTRCGCNTDVTHTSTGSAYGGFYGYTTLKANTFVDCYSQGSVSVDADYGGQHAGGFCGHDDKVSSFTRCYSSGAVTQPNTGIFLIQNTRPYWPTGGGFIGDDDIPANQSSYTACFWDTENSGTSYADSGENEKLTFQLDVDPTAGHYHFTVDGNTTGEIAWDANMATVQAAMDAALGANQVEVDGGSKWTSGSAVKMHFIGNYERQDITTATADVSAIVPVANVSYNEANKGVASISDSDLTGKTTAQMQTQSTFEDEGWDFDDVWYMGESGYPELRMQRLTGLDMNPADIIEDIIEDTRYGAGDTSIIDDTALAAARTDWDARNFRLSFKLDTQKPWLDWVDYILAHCGGYRFKSQGKLHFGVLQDTAAVDSITADDFVRKKNAPAVDITKRRRKETFNRVIVGFTNRDRRYDIDYVTAEDRGDQRRFGVRQKKIKLVGIHTRELAQQIAWRLLIDAMCRFNIYKFKLTFSKLLLDKGDVITLTDGELLSSQRVRIMNIEEAENCSDREITAMDDLAVHYPDLTGFESQQPLHTPDAAITLSDAAIYFREDINSNKIYLSVVPGSAYFNGAIIYYSHDDVTYYPHGRMGVDGVTSGDANSAGTVDGYIPSHPAVSWAKDESILVNIGTVTDLRTDVTDDEFWNDRYLARIGDEIIAFKTAVETATAGIWRISNLRRGLFGTAPVAHYSGETFCTLDRSYTFSYDPTDVGQNLYFKAVVFYGDNYQDISDLTGSSITIQGYYQRPAAASCLRLTSDVNDGGSGTYSGASFTLYWNLGSKSSGFGIGGRDVNPSHESWFYPDSESLLVNSNGVLYGNYIQDPELQAVVLKFEKEDGTAIGEREISVAAGATITKAADLGGFNPAVIKVVPRRALRAWDENSITVDDGS